MYNKPALLQSLKERIEYFFMYLYENGGSDYKPIELCSHLDYQLAGSPDQEQFIRIMDALKFRKLISFTTVQYNKPNFTKYSNILLTEYGLTQGEKVSSQIPLFGLANQSIKTGDPITDKKINHARELFFREPSTMDNMRSACEALSFVLEPLRDELAPTITTADVNEFFLIINRFDVRHNKASTKSLVYPEQLEWVFYSLLNTINTYTKLKSRLNS